MNVHFSEEDAAFRAEVCAFIDANLPGDLRARLKQGFPPRADDIRSWQRCLAAKGWGAPSWPQQYGGPGWTPVQQFLFMDEVFGAPAPEPFILNSNVAGPLIIKYGSDEQKRYFLPKMLNLDIWFCIGMSEPGSGSDLASLRTKAERRGERYVVNGQKVWTSTAHDANWIMCMVRTRVAEKPQLGITLLMIEMNTPGITVRPIISLDGRHHFNEVFFDNVEVPVANRLGEEDRGWAYAKSGLSDERVGIARVGLARERLHYACHLAGEKVEDDGNRLSANPTFKERAAALEADIQALEIMQLRMLSEGSFESESEKQAMASLLKITGSELWQATSELVVDVAGESALPAAGPFESFVDDDHGDAWGGGVLCTYFYSRAATIYGGTTEIQKNIVAKGRLGL